MYVKILAGLALGVCMAITIQAANAAQQQMTHEGTVVSAGSGKLEMKTDAGKTHTHTIDSGTQITVQGKPGKLEDLKSGTRVRVTMGTDGKVTAVATVDTGAAPATH